MIYHFVEKNQFLPFPTVVQRIPANFTIKGAIDTSFVVSVAILAASIWIFSRSSFSYC